MAARVSTDRVQKGSKVPNDPALNGPRQGALDTSLNSLTSPVWLPAARIAALILGSFITAQEPPTLSAQAPGVPIPNSESISKDVAAEKLFALAKLRQESASNLEHRLRELRSDEMKGLKGRKEEISSLELQQEQLALKTSDQALRLVIDVSKGGEVSQSKALLAAHSLGLFDNAISGLVARYILRSDDSALLSDEAKANLATSVAGSPPAAEMKALVQYGMAVQGSPQRNIFELLQQIGIERDTHRIKDLIHSARALIGPEQTDKHRADLWSAIERLNHFNPEYRGGASFAVLRSLLISTELTQQQKVLLLKDAPDFILESIPVVLAGSGIDPGTRERIKNVLPTKLQQSSDFIMKLAQDLKDVTPQSHANASSLLKQFNEPWEECQVDPPKFVFADSTQPLSLTDIEQALSHPVVYRAGGMHRSSVGEANYRVLSADSQDPFLKNYHELLDKPAQQHLAGILKQFTTGEIDNYEFTVALVELTLRYPKTPAALSAKELALHDLEPLGLGVLYNRLTSSAVHDGGNREASMFEALLQAHGDCVVGAHSTETARQVLNIFRKVARGTTLAQNSVLEDLDRAVMDLGVEPEVREGIFKDLIEIVSSDQNPHAQAVVTQYVLANLRSSRVPEELLMTQLRQVAKLPIFTDAASYQKVDEHKQVLIALFDTICTAVNDLADKDLAAYTRASRIVEMLFADSGPASVAPDKAAEYLLSAVSKDDRQQRLIGAAALNSLAALVCNSAELMHPTKREEIRSQLEHLCFEIINTPTASDGINLVHEASSALGQLQTEGLVEDGGRKFAKTIESLYRGKKHQNLIVMLDSPFSRVAYSPESIESLVKVMLAAAIDLEIQKQDIDPEFAQGIVLSGRKALVDQVNLAKEGAEDRSDFTEAIAAQQSLVVQAIDKILRKTTPKRARDIDHDPIKELFLALNSLADDNREEALKFVAQQLFHKTKDLASQIRLVQASSSALGHLSRVSATEQLISPQLLDDIISENKKLIRRLISENQATESNGAVEAAKGLLSIVDTRRPNQLFYRDPHGWVDFAVELIKDDSVPSEIKQSVAAYLGRMLHNFEDIKSFLPATNADFIKSLKLAVRDVIDLASSRAIPLEDIFDLYDQIQLLDEIYSPEEKADIDSRIRDLNLPLAIARLATKEGSEHDGLVNARLKEDILALKFWVIRSPSPLVIEVAIQSLEVAHGDSSDGISPPIRRQLYEVPVSLNVNKTIPVQEYAISDQFYGALKPYLGYLASGVSDDLALKELADTFPSYWLIEACVREDKIVAQVDSGQLVKAFDRLLKGPFPAPETGIKGDFLFSLARVAVLRECMERNLNDQTLSEHMVEHVRAALRR
jgi:hypothetical protein